MKRHIVRRRKKQQLSFPEISLTPLIDTALTLLIIFMVTTPMLQKENALQIELPKGSMQEVEEGKKQELVIALDAKGTYALNGVVTLQKNLITALKKQLGNQKDRTVFVKADTGVKYGKVIELVDSIKHVAGVGYVALATAKMA